MGGWSGAVEAIAPGCLGQCARYGICASIGKVIGVWGRTHSKEKAKHKACETNQACPRRLSETPAQDVAAQALEQTQSTEAHVEHASKDISGLHENVTLDAMVTAALSSSAQGCHCSTGKLRQCGMRCFSKHGSVRISCITDCLDALHHVPHWCSQCYARRSDCTMNKCLSKCASGPTSKKCTDCVHS